MPTLLTHIGEVFGIEALVAWRLLKHSMNGVSQGGRVRCRRCRCPTCGTSPERRGRAFGGRYPCAETPASPAERRSTRWWRQHRRVDAVRGVDDADLSLPALATTLAEFLTELDLHQVTVVCNDWGGRATPHQPRRLRSCRQLGPCLLRDLRQLPPPGWRASCCVAPHPRQGRSWFWRSPVPVGSYVMRQ